MLFGEKAMIKNQRLKVAIEKAKESAKELFKEKPEDITKELEKEKTLGKPENLITPDTINE